MVALSTVLQAGQDTAFGDDLQVGPAALRAFGLSNSGEVVARLNMSSDSFGHFVGDPGNVRLVNQTGAAAPDGLGSFVADPPRLPAAINSQSAVALATAVDDITMDYLGLYVDQGAGLVEQTRTGNPTFGGTLLGLVSKLKLNDRGDLMYAMVSSDNDRIQRLVLRRDGVERLVASQGDTVSPDVGGTLNNFNGFTLNNAQTGFNDAGQVAFAYALDNGEQGIALADVQFVLPDALFKDSFESIVP